MNKPAIRGGRPFDDVDWEGIQNAIDRLPKHRQHWITKQVLGECGVNTVMVKRKEKSCDKCKRCGEVETPIHVWKCRAVESISIWRQSIAKLRTHLENSNTDPSITEEIISGLLTWYQLEHVDQNYSESLNTRQSLIGWDFLIEGWLSKEWRSRQQNFLSLNKNKSSVKRWVSALILKLWEVAWDLWEHRNGVEHSFDQELLNQQLDVLIEYEIQHHSFGDYEMLDRMFFENEIQKLRASTVGYKKAWLRNVDGAKKYSARQRNRNGIRGMQQVMRRFLRF